MEVSISGVKEAIDYYNSNNRMDEVLSKLSSVVNAAGSVTNFPYSGDLAVIKSKILNLNNDEFSMLSRATDTYNALLSIGNGYNPSDSEMVMFLAGTDNGQPLELTRNRMIYLTFQLTKSQMYSSDQKQYLRKLGYDDNDVDLILRNIKNNREVFNKNQFNNIYEVHAFAGKDFEGNVVDKIPYKYLSQERINATVESNSYYSKHPEKVEVAHKALYIYDKLTDHYKFSDAGAKAILTNMMHESPNLDPTEKNSSGAYGLCQWLDRRDDLFVYATSNEKDVNSIDTQLDFMVHELNTNDHYRNNLLPYLNGEKGNNYRESTMKFCAMYEIPSNDPVKAIDIGYFRADDNPGTNKLIDDIFNK